MSITRYRTGPLATARPPALALLAFGFAAAAHAAPANDVESLGELARLDSLQDLQAPLEALKSLQSLSALKSLDSLHSFSAYEALDALDGGDDAPGSIGSDTPIDEHRPLNADGHVRISNVSGSVVVSSWSKNEVAVSGELGAGSEKLDINGDSGNLNVVVRLPKRSHNVADTDLRLSVPVGAHVEVETVSADVTARDVAGPVKVNTVSGEVALQLASPEVSVQTVSGDLTVSAPSHLTRINTVSGDVKLVGVQDQLIAETVSGNVQLDGGRFSLMRLKSISGDMRIAASFAPQAQVNGETLSGNITIAVPSNLSGMARLKSFSGDTRFEGAQNASLKKYEYVIGSGTGVNFDLSSFSGDIHIEKK